MGKKILNIAITGGTGFLGTVLTESLRNQSFSLTIGSTKARTRPDDDQVKYHTTDWKSKKSIEQFCADKDVIIHTAGMSSKECANNPEVAKDFQHTITGSLVENAYKYEVPTFLNLSTVHVYADHLSGTINESTATNSKSPYAISKLIGENYISEARKMNATRYTSLRLANVYGVPFDLDSTSWDLFVNGSCRQAIENKKIEIRTDGSQLRDFLTTDDFAKIIKHIVINEQKVLPEFFNITSGQSTSLLQFAELIQRIARRELKLAIDLQTTSDALSMQISHHLEIGTNYPYLYKHLVKTSKKTAIMKLLKYCQRNFSPSASVASLK